MQKGLVNRRTNAQKTRCYENAKVWVSEREGEDNNDDENIPLGNNHPMMIVY